MNLLSDPKKRIGLAIIGVGILLVVLSNMNMGWLFIVVAGIILTGLALFRKESLWLLPGCLLIGMGFANFLTYENFTSLLIRLRNSNMSWILFIIGGIIFAYFAIRKRTSLLLFPSFIFIGIGLATFLTNDKFLVANQASRSGVFMFVASMGWFLATFFSTRTSGRLLLWTLIPGILMIVLGLIAIQQEVLYIPLTFVRSYWAFIVVAIGVFIFSQDLLPSEVNSSNQDFEDIPEAQ